MPGHSQRWGNIIEEKEEERKKIMRDPKQLLSVANKPRSCYALEDLIEAGISDIAIMLGKVFPDKGKKSYGISSKFGAKITSIYQDKARGISYARQIRKGFIGSNKKFVVYLDNNILASGIKHHLSGFAESNNDELILDANRYIIT